jgi:hypothetical protein
MNATALPSYAFLIAVIVVVANLATAWLVMLSVAENSGSFYDQGPAWLAVISSICLALSYYNAILPVELSFWGSAGLGAMGLWGAWVDYARLADRRKIMSKEANARKKAS